ncbi:carboxymuconolactone decarboxylase family protein [Rhodococcus sp. KBS0724]|uniref:carboxymuconolactone decarboxylase family protein n=1 Tax=Rhodococcus sp. KBS0724 TaxID=1179674 RepID=UPI00110F3958|nr:carboxymuconolactone decarboxylase family protein [Rhodococcus sp. KBS0724]TSD47551.1 carboxymuconolactone decarboxylase family protein [Rhodococcus sp. KBS0724]
MTSTARIPRTEIKGIYGGLVKMVMRKMIGRVPESAEMLWNHPAVFKDMMKFGGRTEKWDKLDRNLATFATMAAAAEIGCSFCLDFGYFTAHNKGLDEAKAREIPRWRESDVFTPLERQVLEYAEAMCQTSPTVTDEMSAALREELGTPALIELTAKVAFMNLSARSNVALGIHSEEYATSCGLRPLAAPKP